ncbi:MAG: peptide chain release factor N(5)-glutamine methyltransferase, partial [Prolixibacteraceae bacterium]|nr:peptide chain release factor N(5)-glutamine methyltransferase [Prolixibacteraceae bacterium]
MKDSMKYIAENLEGLYDKNEIDSFIYLIFNHLLGYGRKEMILMRNEILSTENKERIHEVVERLKVFEPVQYILGETEFYGLRFFVKPGVLIPRNETEELVDLIIKRNKHKKISVLDVGTGSGCIPVAVKKYIPESEVWSCDISETALSVAKENAFRNSVEIFFVNFDILSNQTFPVTGFDIIVSNPPYVTEKEKQLMQPNVLEYEPHEALFVPDNDPLKFYRAIIEKADT